MNHLLNSFPTVFSRLKNQIELRPHEICFLPLTPAIFQGAARQNSFS
jgi:hypothetical protein